jgi:hypothetical protein
MAEVAALSLVGAVTGAVGGIVFWAVHGETTLERAISYGLWIAATLCLALMIVVGRKIVWRRTSLPVPESWVWVAAASVLTIAGAAIDSLGS